MKKDSTKQLLILFSSIIFAFIIILGVKALKDYLSPTSDTTTHSADLTTTVPAATETTTEETTTVEQTTTAEATTQSYTDISVVFGGNLIIRDSLVDSAASHHAMDSSVFDIVSNADISMLNLQSNFSTEADRNINSTSTLFTSPNNVDVISSLGFKSVSLANNYIMESGRDALTSTIQTLDDAGITHTGAGANLSSASKPIITTINGKKICIISSCRNIPDNSWIAEDKTSTTDDNAGVFSSREADAVTSLISESANECDIVIAYMNCGDELSENLDIYQQYLAHQFIDAGADMVVGCFPTLVQGIEYYKGAPIFYSLGNLITGSEESTDSMLLNIKIKEDNSLSCKLLPCISSTDSIAFSDETKRADFISKINSLSEDMNALINDDGTVVSVD